MFPFFSRITDLGVLGNQGRSFTIACPDDKLKGKFFKQNKLTKGCKQSSQADVDSNGSHDDSITTNKSQRDNETKSNEDTDNGSDQRTTRRSIVDCREGEEEEANVQDF